MILTDFFTKQFLENKNFYTEEFKFVEF